MIDAALDLVREFGILAGGGIGVITAGLWLRRLQIVATWVRVASVVAVLTGAGAVAGVVDLARLWELVLAGYRMLPLVIGYALEGASVA